MTGVVEIFVGLLLAVAVLALLFGSAEARDALMRGR
jgi:hypothetical protein